MSTPFTQWSHGRLRAGSLDRRLAPHSPLEPARPGRYRSWARGLAFRRPLPGLPARMLDDRVRAGEHQGGVTVVESHQVGRLPARSPDLDNLARPPRMTHDIGMHVEPVPYCCLHAPTSSSVFVHGRSAFPALPARRRTRSRCTQTGTDVLSGQAFRGSLAAAAAVWASGSPCP